MALSSGISGYWKWMDGWNKNVLILLLHRWCWCLLSALEPLLFTSLTPLSKYCYGIYYVMILTLYLCISLFFIYSLALVFFKYCVIFCSLNSSDAACWKLNVWRPLEIQPFAYWFTSLTPRAARSETTLRCWGSIGLLLPPPILSPGEPLRARRVARQLTNSRMKDV